MVYLKYCKKDKYMSDLKISVIVPIYKVEKYLDRCIDSIINQTYKHLEIILVDDGSPDHCPQMCDEWAKKDNRIKVIHKINGGVSSARNAGLDVATGEYIQFVDSDDYLELNACETLVDKMITNDADIVVSGFTPIGNHVKCIKAVDFATRNFMQGVQNLYICGVLNAIWNKLYKKNLINHIRFQEKMKYGEDLLFNLQYMQNCQLIVYTSEPLYNYVNTPGSVVHSFSKQCFNDHCKIYDYIEKEYKKKYSQYLQFFNKMQSNLILFVFTSLVQTTTLTNKQKKDLIKTYTNTTYFKKAKQYATSLVKKIQCFLLQRNCFKILKLLYKIKGGAIT